jgi:hypothetical protein
MADSIKYTYKPLSVAMDAAKINMLAENQDQLERLGIVVTDKFKSDQGQTIVPYALDSITQPVTTPANGTPVQFLQAFLPGVVNILTKVRKADYIAPVSTAGDWFMEEVVLKVMEHTGSPRLYSDHGAIPLASFNETYVKRQIVRFELGVQMTNLADACAAATGTNPQAEKRGALANGFEILRNDIAFNGFDIGNGTTYGMLNDPLLPAYVTVANGAGGDSEWSTKTVAEKVSDLLTAASALRVQSGGNVDPKKDIAKLTMGLSVVDLLSDVDDSMGSAMSVQKWLNDNYPTWVIEDAPQFDGANAGANVFYLSAEKVDDGSSDDNAVMTQIVPAKMVALGTEQKAKGTIEAYTAAYAGVFVKRAYAVVRYTGI